MRTNPGEGFVAATLLIAATVQAQLVVPAALDGIEGGSSSSIPFGLSSPVRYQCVYDGDQLPFSGPRKIEYLRFRADANGGVGFPGKQFLRVDIDMSTSTVRSDSAFAEFDRNHGVDRQRVATFVQIALPPQPDLSGNGPRPANVEFVLDPPFWYGLTPVRDGEVPTSLVVDLQIRSQPAGTYRLDSPFSCDSQIASFGTLGPNCRPGGDPANLEVSITSSNDIRAGGTVTWTVSDMPANAPFIVNVWLDRLGDWLGVPLPAPLHPDAPDCQMLVRMGLVGFPGLADTAGVGTASLGLPSDRSIVGQTFYAQAVVQDITANPFGHIVSPGVQSTVCGPLGCARIFSIGDAAATTGNVTFGAASILEVQ